MTSRQKNFLLINNFQHFQGKYSLKPTVLEIASLPSGIPDFLADGDFKVNAKLFDGNSELGCVDVAFTLKLNN